MGIKKLLVVAAAGAFSLSGCGLFELADAIQDAAENAAAQVKKEVTEQNVKGAIHGMGAAMRAIKALENMGPGGAPRLRPLNTETQECSGGGTVTFSENADETQFTMEAVNCVDSKNGQTVEANGTLTVEITGDYESGNVKLSYTANFSYTLKDDATGAVIEAFSYNNLTMVMEMVVDQAAGKMSYTYRVNGSITMTEGSETNTVGYTDFVMKMSAEGEMTSASFSIDGGISLDLADAACTDGSFTFETTTPLTVGDGGDCPTAGVLKINGVTYTFADGSVTATMGEESETFSCAEITEGDECSFAEGDDDDDDYNDDEYNDDEYPDEESSETM